MNVKMRLSILLFLFIFVFYGISFAQVVPGGAKAGEVEKGLEKEKPKLEKERAPSVEVEIPEKELEVPEGQKFLVKKFIFKSNTILKTSYLNKLVRKYKNRQLSLKDLQAVTKTITSAYQNRGYFLARAYLPVQDITDGTVTIEIIEGKLGKVSIEGEKFYRKKFIRNHFRPEYKGIINYRRLLKSLLVLNGYQKLNVKASLTKGASPNTVDIALKAEDKLPLNVSTDYNNFGTKYVSRHRIGASIDYSNLLVGGDKMSFRGVTGSPKETLGFSKAEYSFPINSYGTKAMFSYTWADFNVQREFKMLDAGGSSKIWSVDFLHPITRTRFTNLDFDFGFDYKKIKNYLLGQISSDDELRVFRSGINWDHIDSFQGKNYASAMVSGGVDGIMGSLRHDDPRASRVGAGGEFLKTNLELARFQKFLGNVYFLTRISSQFASDVLPIAEQFPIGGADTVRGYPQSEYLGDYGYCASFELRFSPPFLSEKRIPFTHKSFKESVQLLGFIDYGNVFLRNALVGEKKHNEITGAGCGLRVNFGEDLDIRLDWGFPIEGREPSDGSTSTTYIQIIKRF